MRGGEAVASEKSPLLPLEAYVYATNGNDEVRGETLNSYLLRAADRALAGPPCALLKWL